MRPLDVPRSRTGSFTDKTAVHSQPPPMAFVLANEATLESAASSSVISNNRRIGSLGKQSNYGIQSLQTMTRSSVIEQENEKDTNIDIARKNFKKALMSNAIKTDSEAVEGSDSHSISPESSLAPSVDGPLSEPLSRASEKHTTQECLTPLSLRSPALGSMQSDLSSRQDSVADFLIDGLSIHDTLSKEQDEKEGESTEDIDSSASQLVMPSIKMPTRRPFTEQGKHMGRLKVLIAGDSGSGKTSLISSMVQLCPDIVHADAVTNSATSTNEGRSKRKPSSSSKHPSRSKSASVSTKRITEIYASTKSYPSWYSTTEIGDTKNTRRRKSSLTSEAVLERNICFVDTPGYSSYSECIATVATYIESHLERTSSAVGRADSDTINLLSGNGGSQVDLVLYMIREQLKAQDLEYIHRLSHLTNLVPVIAYSDTLSVDQIRSRKANTISQFRESSIKPFLFGRSFEEILSTPEFEAALPPYAVSCLKKPDDDTMDASLLMSPDYTPPLVPSDLASMLGEIFTPENMSWLRHSAAKKALAYFKSRPVAPSESLPRSILRPFNMMDGPLSRNRQGLQLTSQSQINLYTDYRAGEQQAQVHVSKWASDLQRSIQNERARFEAIASGERAVWLTDRLGECVANGTIVPRRANQEITGSGIGDLVPTGSYSRKRNQLDRSAVTGVSNSTTVDRQDPLGILKLRAEMRQRTWHAIQLAGSFSVIGGLMIWIAGRWKEEKLEEVGQWTWRLTQDW